MNTKAPNLLQNVDFSGAGSHLAYTLGEGAASLKNNAYLFKGEEHNLTLEERERAIVLAKGVTYNTRRKLLEDALRYVYPDGCWVNDFSDEIAYVEDGSEHYQVCYSESESGNITIVGNPVQVIPQVVYVPVTVESLAEPTLDSNSTIRDVEKCLRECGMSRKLAKALVCNGFKDATETVNKGVPSNEQITELLNLVKKL